jgi:hypothetical protein
MVEDKLTRINDYHIKDLCGPSYECPYIVIFIRRLSISAALSEKRVALYGVKINVLFQQKNKI